MRKNWIVAIVVAAGLLVGSVASAQDTLIWFNAAVQNGPDAVTPVPGNPDNPAVGGLVQVILAAGAVPSAPTYSGDGLTGGDSLLEFCWVGHTSGSDGIIADFETWANLGIVGADDVYVRVYDRPSGDAAGALPTAIDYSGNAAVVALYNADFLLAGTTVGTFYFDGPVQQANASPAGGNFYNYQIPTIGSGGWTFLPSAVIPEPGTWALAGLGGLAMLIFRRRK